MERVLAAVRGREATQFETIRRQLNSAPPGLMAALNMAMLDVVGRHVKAPVYQILGGPTRNKCRALAPLDGSSDAELTASLRRARDAGYKPTERHVLFELKLGHVLATTYGNGPRRERWTAV